MLGIRWDSFLRVRNHRFRILRGILYTQNDQCCVAFQATSRSGTKLSWYYMSVVWPVELTNMNLLHKVRLDRDETSSDFIARLMSFKSFIRPLRKSIQDEIRSTYTVRLPFVVQVDVVLRKNSTFTWDGKRAWRRFSKSLWRCRMTSTAL